MASTSVQFKKNRRLALLKPGSLALLLIAKAAGAQSPEATLQPVVVNDRNAAPVADVLGLGDAPLARTPVSATLIEAQQIEASGARRLADLVKFDASVSDAYNAQGYWDFVTVRGFVLDNKYNYRREGLPISAESTVPLDNKARVEILRGTSGIQAGTSAPGGLVNYVVKRPTENTLRNVRLETSNHGGVLASIDLGGRFGLENALGYRINAAAEDIDSYVRDLDGQRRLLAAAFDWRLSRDSVLEAEVEYSRRSQRSAPGLSLLGNQLPAPDPRLNLNAQPWSLPVVLEGLTGTVKFEQAINSQWRWSAQAGTQRLKSDDRTAFPYGGDCFNGPFEFCDRFTPNGDYDLYDFRSENERRTLSAGQLQLKGRIDTGGLQHDLGLGLLASRTRDRFNQQAYNYVGTGNLATVPVFAPAPELTDENTNRSERSTELSVFDAITWSPRLTTWVGLRHTQLERDSVRTDGSRRTRYQRSINTPWVAASYQLTPAHMVYASHGQGVESEVAPGRARYTNAGQALPALKSRQTELGVKAELAVWRWSAALFRIHRPLFADVGTCDGDNSCTRQVDGGAVHQGAEINAGTQTGAWAINGGLTLIDAERRGSVNPALNGKRPVNVPQAIARGQADYRVAAVPGLSLQAHVSYEAARSAVPDDSVSIPGWIRFDTGARYSTHWLGTPTTWTLGVHNLLDRRYFKESPYQFGHAYLFPGAPRTLRLSFQASL